MKIIFAGTPDFAVAPLEALLQSGHEVIAVYSQPDRPAGRGRVLTPSPVKQAALAAGIQVLQPLNFKAEADRQQLAALQPDLMVVVAYGLLLPQAVLDIPRLGCLNIHASILPRWRGAAPIQRALAAGDAQTGVCIMQMEAGLDTGPVHLMRSLSIEPEDTAQSLHDRLAVLGAEALLETLPLLEQPGHSPTPQDDAGACYAQKLSKDEAWLDWTQDARTLELQIRAFNPWPVAQTQYQDQTLRIWLATALDAQPGNIEPGSILETSAQGIDVATGKGVLRLQQLQLPGKKAMAVADFIKANKLQGRFTNHAL
jgi:methionyl-tRNA formyltransferase